VVKIVYPNILSKKLTNMVQNYFCMGFFIQDIICPEKNWELCIEHLWNFKKKEIGISKPPTSVTPGPHPSGYLPPSVIQGLCGEGDLG
jgi:hypothetical protein